MQGDALGGSMYWGASVEFQTPLYFLPKDSGVRVAAFADAGSLWNYVGPTILVGHRRSAINGSLTARPGARPSPIRIPCPVDNGMNVRSSVGVGLIWDSPFGPLRFDYSFPLTKAALRPGAAIPLRRRNFVLISAAQPRYKVA